MSAALDQVDIWVESPSLSLLGESAGTWPLLRELLIVAAVTGARVHDARIAAICLAHSVRELWTADRDYGRFPTLRTRNPLTRNLKGRGREFVQVAPASVTWGDG